MRTLAARIRLDARELAERLETGAARARIAALKEQLAQEQQALRALGGRKPAAAQPTGDAEDKKTFDTAEVRRWALEHGHRVSDKGRIAADIVQAYHAAHPAP